MTFFYSGFWLHFLCTTTLLWLASNFVDRHVPTYLFQKRSTVVLINYSISNLSSIKGNLILLFNISSYTIQFQNMLKSYFDKNTTKTTQFQPRTAAKRLSQQKSKRKTNQKYFTELPDCLEKICHRRHCTISNNIVTSEIPY